MTKQLRGSAIGDLCFPKMSWTASSSVPVLETSRKLQSPLLMTKACIIGSEYVILCNFIILFCFWRCSRFVVAIYDSEFKCAKGQCCAAFYPLHRRLLFTSPRYTHSTDHPSFPNNHWDLLVNPSRSVAICSRRITNADGVPLC